MKVNDRLIEDLIFNRFQRTSRFTQDSPVYPDVWLDYYNNADNLATHRADLIFVPHRKATAAELFKVLTERLARLGDGASGMEREMATSTESVAARLTFRELITVALPLTKWWHHYLWEKNGEPTADEKWLRELVGAVQVSADKDLRERDLPVDELLNMFKAVFNDFYNTNPVPGTEAPIVLWSVSRNRQASFSIEKSVPTTKADAGRQLFGVNGAGIAWAVLDTGIDARHKAFRKTDPATQKPCAKAMGAKTERFSNNTRVVETYDFTKFRTMLAQIHASLPVAGPGKPGVETAKTSDKHDESLSDTEIKKTVLEIERNLKEGRLFDWSLVAPLLKIPHNEDEYEEPVHPHGTHVAGIIGAGMEPEKGIEPLIGMCPSIDLYDIRVMDSRGVGDEFNILAAIQFIRWLNNKKDGPMIHGVNLSLSIPHEVASYACGQTPVCEACDRLVADGTVVVAAAGNNGQTVFRSKDGMLSEGFRTVNITDPGNADLVITVGATHRNKPHSYGVSYFSSKGPTGDGRIKPDLVAPGEKIVSTGIGEEGIETMDGTSMAAPHVSGAAALLLARHRELIGRPRRVKEILCRTATDLGRERYFQGCGLIDVLRAIQSV